MVGRCVLIAAFTVCGVPAIAHAGASPDDRSANSIVRKVMVIKWRTKLGTSGVAKHILKLGEIVTVSRVNGGFMWVEGFGGWIRSADVVAINEADAHFTKRLSTSRTAANFIDRGVARVSLNRLDDSIADFTAAIDLDAKNWAAYNNRGNSWYQTGNFDKSLSDYERAIQLNPKSDQSWDHRSRIWIAKQDWPRALRDVNRAIELDAKNASAYNHRGIVHLKTGHLQQAIADHTRAIEIEPRFDVAYANRAYVHKQIGEFGKSLNDYRQSLALNPDSHTAHNDLAWILSTCRDKSFRNGKQAVNHAQKACELTNFKNWNMLDTLAAAHAESKNFESALKWLNKAIEHAPESQLSELNQRAKVYRSQSKR